MTRRVVILLSDKRSGSTFLEQELCKHPDIQHVRYTPHSYNETHYWVMAAHLLKCPRQLFSGGRAVHSYGGYSSTRRLIIKTIKGNVPDFVPPDDDRQLVFTGWEALCAAFAAPVFFEKSPQHPHHWAALELIQQWVQQTTYEVRFILLFRNPMAVMYSAFKLFHTDPSERQFGWAESVRNMLLFSRMVGDRRCLSLRYEDVIAEPAEQFSVICAFIGIDDCPALGSSAYRDSESKWLSDNSYGLVLHPHIKRLANFLGYTDADISKPVPSLNYQKQGMLLSFRVLRLKNRFYNMYKRVFR